MTMEGRTNNPATAIVVGALNDQSALLREIRNALVRRESPAPGTYKFWPNGLRVQPQLRVSSIAISPIAAFTAAIRIGSHNRYIFLTPADGVVNVSLDIVLNVGETVQLIDTATGLEATASQVVDAWINAFVDVPSRPDELG